MTKQFSGEPMSVAILPGGFYRRADGSYVDANGDPITGDRLEQGLARVAEVEAGQLEAARRAQFVSSLSGMPPAR